MISIDRVSTALHSEGFALELRLIEIEGDRIPKICMVEKESGVIAFKSGSFDAMVDFIQGELGRRWMQKNDLLTQKE